MDLSLPFIRRTLYVHVCGCVCIDVCKLRLLLAYLERLQHVSHFLEFFIREHKPNIPPHIWQNPKYQREQ